jgi:hypothetical protein
MLHVLWKSLVCLGCFNCRSLFLKVWSSNPVDKSFDLIKKLTQIINFFQKIDKMKSNLIYAKMVKVLLQT